MEIRHTSERGASLHLHLSCTKLASPQLLGLSQFTSQLLTVTMLAMPVRYSGLDVTDDQKLTAILDIIGNPDAVSATIPHHSLLSDPSHVATRTA